MNFRFEASSVFDRHIDIIRGVVSAGVAAKDVIQVDVHGRPGSCVVTLSCPAVQDALLSRTLTICGKEYHPVTGDGSVEVTHVHVYGCPAKLNDCHVKTGLSAFGEVVGNVRRDTISFEGVKIQTGVRIVALIKNGAVPCKVKFCRAVLRVWHRGQEQSCFVCKDVGHKAKDCPKRSKVKAATSESLGGNLDDQHSTNPETVTIYATNGTPDRQEERRRTSTSTEIDPSAVVTVRDQKSSAKNINHAKQQHDTGTHELSFADIVSGNHAITGIPTCMSDPAEAHAARGCTLQPEIISSVRPAFDLPPATTTPSTRGTDVVDLTQSIYTGFCKVKKNDILVNRKRFRDDVSDTDEELTHQVAEDDVRAAAVAASST